MKILLNLKGYQTLTEAYNQAIIVSNEMEQEEIRTKPPPLLNSSAPPFFPRNNPPTKNFVRNQGPFPPTTCTYCSKIGHTASQCFQNPQNQTNKSTSNRPPPIITCTYCNKFGHTASQCFRNPQNQTNNTSSQHPSCTYCGRTGHTASQCYKKKQTLNPGNHEHRSSTDDRRDGQLDRPVLTIEAKDGLTT